MTRDLEVSFNSPQCGWMSIGFDDGVDEFHTTTAHAPHQLALPELLKILTELLDASEPQANYVLAWNRDPEAFDFRFFRDGATVLMEIYQYPSEDRVESERECVFTYTGDVGSLCRAFAATFDQLYQDRETDEFEFNWRQHFPLEQYEEFKKRFR
jgi:ribonuclease BN (tRNA processing enzyme)